MKTLRFLIIYLKKKTQSFDTIHIDHIRLFRKTASNNISMLVILDYYIQHIIDIKIFLKHLTVSSKLLRFSNA